MSKNLPIQTMPGWGGVDGGWGGAPNFNNPHPLIIQGLDYFLFPQGFSSVLPKQ